VRAMARQPRGIQTTADKVSRGPRRTCSSLALLMIYSE
jgi:hypothetical protein